MLDQADTICPCFSSGEQVYLECIMPAANKLMLDFFRDVVVEGDAFVNAPTEIYGGGEVDPGDGDDDDDDGDGYGNGVALDAANGERVHDPADHVTNGHVDAA